MVVLFRRTDIRRYAVVVEVDGRPPQVADPAPGFDDLIPHDLVHYAVEAELGLGAGVFGRAARGGGTFIATASGGESDRQRARERRRQLRREASLRSADHAGSDDMVTSERLAGVCDVLWRRRHGQRPDPARPAPPLVLSAEDARRVERVLARLDVLAPLWSALPTGGALAFRWPSAVPSVRAPAGEDATSPRPGTGAPVVGPPPTSAPRFPVSS